MKMRRGFPITKAMQAERRKRAEERNAEYNKRYPTTQAKLDALPATGATKQRTKLAKRLEEENSKAEAAKLAATAKAEAKAEKSEKSNNNNKKGKNQ
jgi:hypothetical protein